MMTPNNVRDWNPNAPLPHGVTLLEASAGTGKTYQIAHLVMRLVAEEGHRIDRLLVMTFTRDATAELRERLLARIAKASSCLAPGAPPATDDPTLYAWVDMMNTTGRAEAARHHLERALREFDRAAIATIHSFCQQVLTRFAFDSDTAHDLEAIADLSPVIRDFVVDFVTRTGFSADDATWRQLAPKGAPELKPWIRLAELALLDPDAATDPLPDGTSLFDPIYLEQLARAFRPAAAFFAKHRDALVGWLDAAYADGRLKINNRKTKYKADNNRAHADTLGAWLDDPTNTPTPTDTPFKHFDPATIRGDADNPDLDVPADFARFMQLLASARAAIDSPSAAVELPIRQRFVAELRARWPELMRARGQVAFQDLLERLAAAVSDPRPDGPGPRLRRAMADAWPVVLLDEFQDTDRVQWAIFERAFADRPDGRLLLIGDPKQAIYGFRGANIHVYFRAAQCAGPNRYTLTTNYRSDPGLMQAFNRMFGQPAFFDIADLAYHPNDAAAPAARLIPGDSLFHDGPFHLRCMRPADGKTMPAGDILKVLPNLVAADIAELLAAGARLVEPTPGTSANDRPIAPSDIAVLVSSHRQAAAIAEALAARDIASVRASSGSVLDTEAFDALLHWLAVLRDPADEGARRLLALTPLFAWSPVDLARLRAASDNDATNPGDPAEAARDAALRDRWAILSRQVVRWREVFDRSGILAAWARTADDADIDGRLLRREDGDRWLTDLRHLIELLHIAQTAERRGLPGLWQWLARQRDQQDTDAHRRRLERDDAAVRIVTTHASKGLEYPIVFAPFVWSAREPKAPLLATHPADPSRRALCLDLSPGAPAVARTDDRQERLRLLYVAWTRARNAVVTYTVPYRANSRTHLGHSALGVALHAGPAWRDGPPPAESRIDATAERIGNLGSTPSALVDALTADLAALAVPGLIGWSEVRPPSRRRATASSPPASPVTTPTEPPASPQELMARAFERGAFDSTFSLLSYTALVRAHEHRGAQNPEREGADYDTRTSLTADLPPIDLVDDLAAPSDVPSGTHPSPATEPAAPLPLAAFPAGADAGVALHGIYEDLDFQVVHGPSDTLSTIADRLRRHGLTLPPNTLPTIADGFYRTLRTPLGGPLGDFRLGDLARPPRPPAMPAPSAALRLDELRFDFPVAGGTAWRASHHAPADGRQVAAAFAIIPDLIAATHLDPRDPPALMSAAHAEALTHLDFGPLAGLFKGFMDLVFRAPTPTGPRYFVADYKSNYLRMPAVNGQRGPTQLAAYARDGMRAEMERHHYHLQAAVYLLALHRFLRTRLGPAYDYDTHVGGAYYLFVRGMIAPAALQPAPVPPHLAPLVPPGTTTMSEPPHGVWFERPPRALIEALDAALPAAPLPKAPTPPGTPAVPTEAPCN